MSNYSPDPTDADVETLIAENERLRADNERLRAEGPDRPGQVTPESEAQLIADMQACTTPDELNRLLYSAGMIDID